MNRGFKTYFKEGVKTSRETLSKKGNYLRFYLSEIISLLGRILGIIFLPLFKISEIRIARQAGKDKKIVISKSYQSSDNIRVYWTGLLVLIEEFLLLLGGIILIAIAGGLVTSVISLILLGIGVYYRILYAVIIAFLFPFALCEIIFIIIFFIMMSPSFYIIDSCDGIGASDVIFKSLESTRRSGKGVLVLNALINYLVRILYLGASFGTVYGLSFVLPNTYWDYLIIFVLSIIYLFFRPFFVLSYRNTKTSLFDDLVLDKYNANLKCQGINIRASTAPRNTFKNEKEMLIALFDSEEEQHEPVSSSSLINFDEDDNVKKSVENLLEKYKEEDKKEKERSMDTASQDDKNNADLVKNEDTEKEEKTVNIISEGETSVGKKEKVKKTKEINKEVSHTGKITSLFKVKGNETLFDDDEASLKPVVSSADNDVLKDNSSFDTQFNIQDKNSIENALIPGNNDYNVYNSYEEESEKEKTYDSIDEIIEEGKKETDTQNSFEYEKNLPKEENSGEKVIFFQDKENSADDEDDDNDENLDVNKSKGFSFSSAFAPSSDEEEEEEEVEEEEEKEEERPSQGHFSFSSAFTEDENEEDVKDNSNDKNTLISEKNSKAVSAKSSKKETWKDKPLKLKSIHKQDK